MITCVGRTRNLFRRGALALISTALICCAQRPSPALPTRPSPGARAGAEGRASRSPARPRATRAAAEGSASRALAHRQATRGSGEERASPALARQMRPRPRTSSPLLIGDHGVGRLRLGAPIPAAYLRDAAAPAAHYVIGFHADGQLYEGFRFEKVPVMVLLKQGPFHRWFRSSTRPAGVFMPSPARRARLARDAVDRARRGAPIAWIRIWGPGPKTDKGIGVGSTWAEITRAYGPLTLRPVPKDFGRDRCVVRLKPLASVYAYFATCAAARAGQPITRMAIYP